jgi:hypothetical protein
MAPFPRVRDSQSNGSAGGASTAGTASGPADPFVLTVVFVVVAVVVDVVVVDVAVVLGATVVVTAALVLGVDESAGAVVALSSLDEHAASIVNANNKTNRRRASMLMVSISSVVRAAGSGKRPSADPGIGPEIWCAWMGKAIRRGLGLT